MNTKKKSRLAIKTNPYDLGAVAHAMQILRTQKDVVRNIPLWATHDNPVKRQWATVGGK